MKWNICIFVVVLFAVSLSACTYPTGDEVNISYYGEIDDGNGSFELTGYVSSGGGIGDQDQFKYITVYFLGENESVVDREYLGDVNATYGRLNVSVSTTADPHFIVFNSDDFWDENVWVEYLEYVDGEYATRRASSQSELPEFN